MIEFTKVTWYSQIAAVVLAVIIFLAGVFVGGGMTQMRQEASAAEDELAIAEELADAAEQFLKEQNTITEYSLIQATFTGTYEQIVKQGPVGPVTCNVLTVEQSSSPALVEYYKGMIAQGNGLNAVDEEGRLQISLPWRTIPDTYKNQLQVGDIAMFELIKPGHAGFGVDDPCHSSFLFFRMNSVDTL